MEIMKPFFKFNEFILYHDDCLKLLAKMPENCVDIVFSDSPYRLSNGGFTCKSGKMASVNKGEWDKSEGISQDFVFHQEWIKACKRLLKPNGTIWVCGTYHSIYACGYALQLEGFKILNEIVWYKSNAVPNIGRRCFCASHENIIWAVKDPKGKHTFNYEEMRNGNWHERDFLKKQGKQMRSVWCITPPKPSEKECGKHPTQKPLALLERIIKASSKEGDLILDPFTGSSTTGLVAYKYGRRFIGTDIEEEYLELSKRRFQNAYEKKGQVSAAFN